MSWYWKPAYEDYAPSGMPDFDQKQDGWTNMIWQWTHCGPTAVANCFWWFDSKHNLPPGMPGDGNDQFPLVRDYEDSLPPYPHPVEFLQDDHDLCNVNHFDTPWPTPDTPPPPTIQPFVPGWQNPPIPMPRWGELVERLAWFMNTNDIQGTGSGHTGTRVSDMQLAIDEWFLSETYENGSTLADSLYEIAIPQPTFAQVESLVEISEDVILLLGFWYYEGEQEFIRGDVNADGMGGTLADLMACAGGPPFFCDDAADVNDDGILDTADCEYLHHYLTHGYPPPPFPFPDCGTDPTPDGLGCGSFPPCPGGGQWWRVGGHYVTVAGVNSGDSLVAISDPFVDWAELGNPGRVLNGFWIPHSPSPHDPTEHNDAGNVSHDIYPVDSSLSPGGLWTLRDHPASAYPELWMDNFNGQNIPDEFTPVTQPWNGVSPIYTEIEYAVVISPHPDFEIGAVPETLELMQTESGSYYVTITPIGGYSNSVFLKVEGMPPEVGWYFDPNPAVPPDYCSWLNLSTSMLTPAGQYDLTIIGADLDGNADSVEVVLTIIPWHPPYMVDWIDGQYVAMAKTNYGQEGQTQIIAPSFVWHEWDYLYGPPERRGGGSIVIGNDSTNLALSYGISHQDFTPSESLKVDTIRVDEMLVEYATAKYRPHLEPPDLEITVIAVGLMDTLHGGGEAILQEFIVENKFMDSVDLHFSLFLDWQVGDPLLDLSSYDSLYNYYYQYSTSVPNEVLGVMRTPDRDTSILKGFLAADNRIYIDPQDGWRKDSLWACMNRGTWDNSAGPVDLSALLTSQPFRLESGKKHLESYWLFGYYMFGKNSQDPFQRFLFGLLKLKGYYRGDVNCDGRINSADIVYLIDYLFKEGPRPLPFADHGDVNIDTQVNSADVVYLINYLFKSGPQPIDYDRWLYYILMWRWGVPQDEALHTAEALSTPPAPNTSLFRTRFGSLGKSEF
ncbi:MAG: hypothetical protein AMJ73_07955 [candidate division Zixibacteria bacterium SM1_73]|nr:MAG: hypothetical protein AMJ73_07955 [candidate division Zixibacteria bacterium SM1_73]